MKFRRWCTQRIESVVVWGCMLEWILAWAGSGRQNSRPRRSGQLGGSRLGRGWDLCCVAFGRLVGEVGEVGGRVVPLINRDGPDG